MTSEAAREVVLNAVAVPVGAYQCSACSQLFGSLNECGDHLDRFKNGRWQPWQKPLTPMQRDDGVAHLASYHWTTGPTLTWRAICDGHPLWILGSGVDTEWCPACAVAENGDYFPDGCVA